MHKKSDFDDFNFLFLQKSHFCVENSLAWVCINSIINQISELAMEECVFIHPSRFGKLPIKFCILPNLGYLALSANNLYMVVSPYWQRVCWISLEDLPKQRRTFANTSVPYKCAIWSRL